MAVAAVAMPVIMASMTAAGHRRHINPGAATGGIILLIAIALVGMMVRRWHARSRRPPEPDVADQPAGPPAGSDGRPGPA
jgi:hypothetical protein